MSLLQQIQGMAMAGLDPRRRFGVPNRDFGGDEGMAPSPSISQPDPDADIMPPPMKTAPPAIPYDRPMPHALTEPMAQDANDPILGVDHSRLDQTRQRAESFDQPLSLKQKIIKGLLTAAPIVAGGLMGGGEGAFAAAGGVGHGLQENRRQTLAERMEAEREYDSEANRVGKQEEQNRQTSIMGPLRRAQTRQFDAHARQYDAKADLNPADKTITTADGIKQWNPDTQRYDIPVGGAPAKAGPSDEFERLYGNDPKNWSGGAVGKGELRKATLKDKIDYDQQIQGTKPGKAEPGTWTLGKDKDGNDAMFNSKTGQMKPAGGAAGFTKGGGQPTADEKRRDDLSRNVEENLNQLEDIVNRRPDLFGPFAGRASRLRAAAGTDDKDIAALKTIEDQLGMARIGAHSMRNASHIEKSAQSVMGYWVNSPEAIKASIQSARNSMKTFHQDAGPNPQRGQATPPPATGKVIEYEIRNGQLVPKGTK